MAEIKRVNDKLMFIKLALGGLTINLISAQVQQTGIDKEVKKIFFDLGGVR